MKNKKLSDLNFKYLINYGGQPDVQCQYKEPLKCSGYCIYCEEQKVFPDFDGSFDQMSHGCDTSDYEKVLGSLKSKKPTEKPIIFLLENPGGNYNNGKEVRYNDYIKQPPVNHYYWTPDLKKWPVELSELTNWYGSFFAYLMNKHGLKNVYITNLIKCNTLYDQPYDKKSAVKYCSEKWLLQEIELFKPKFVLCFGHNAFKGFNKLIKSQNLEIDNLYVPHPAHRGTYSGRQKWVEKIDQILTDCI